MKGSQLWLLAIVVGVLVWWWFGVHVKAEVTAGDVTIRYPVIPDRVDKPAPPSSGIDWDQAANDYNAFLAGQFPT